MRTVKFLNRENLRIARENMGLETFEASEEISTNSSDLVEEWENGRSLPTWSQILKLGHLYNVAELLFFSNTLLQKNKTIPDYRIGANPKNDQLVKKLENIVISRQRWLEQDLKENGTEKNEIVGCGKHIQDPKKLAELITEKLALDLSEIKSFHGKGARKKALNYFIKKAEDKGIFVGKTISYIDLEVEDIRGLSVSNDYCPYIIINRRDATSAQIFSFIHELTHLFRKTDGVSNSLEFKTGTKGVNSEEILCNKVAAELLLPEKEFTASFYEKSDIDSISESFKVSKLFIFYRLKDLGKIHREIQSTLEEKIKEETALAVEKKKAEEQKRKPGGNYTNSMKDSNGSLFNRAVAKSYLENKIGYVEASKLLRFSVEKV